MSQPHEFEVHGSEFLWESPILGLRRDRVTMPGGTVANREIVEHFGAVAIAAVDDDGRIAVVRQYRHAVGKRLVEIPAGLLDIYNEDALEAAKRELHEEAGLKAQDWSLLVDVVNSPGYCDEVCRIYLARGVRAIERPEVEDDEEADMTVSMVDLAEAREMVMRGEVHNSIAISGILSAARVVLDGDQARAADESFDLRPTKLASRRHRAGVVPDMKRLGS